MRGAGSWHHERKHCKAELRSYTARVAKLHGAFPSRQGFLPKGIFLPQQRLQAILSTLSKNIKIKKSNAQRYGYHLLLAVPGLIVHPFFLSSLAVCDVWKTKRSKLYNNCCLLSFPTAQQKHKKWTSSFLKERELFHLI